MTGPAGGVRAVVVNADDFGMSEGVNRGVAEAHEMGVVTSASLMPLRAAAAEAAMYARDRPALSLGLHVETGDWRRRNGGWVAMRELAPADDPEAVAAAVDEQLEAFRSLVGRNPTHIDAHQHVHREDPTRSVVIERARRLGVPLRGFAARVRYCGAFYGRGADGERRPDWIGVDALVRILRAVGPGTTEIGCHPGLGASGDPDYADERETELATLCDPRLRRLLTEEVITLCSFHDVSTT